ncbi:GGDEF domain-containing protein [Sessilibacter sp. MAH4]
MKQDKNMPEGMENWHWMMYILQTIDVGLVVVDKDYRICVWNSFMENHSGKLAQDVSNRPLFDIFPEIQKDWFQHKIDSVFLLDNRAYTIWEERPYVFKFKNYRPITSTADFMYQYTTLLPLKSVTGETSHVAIVVYDVTDIAVNRMALKKANKTLEEISITDQMTRLYNRSHWENCLLQEFKRHARHNEMASLIMFDIDHFKKVNDTYGHHPGDVVIKSVAQELLNSKRDIDIAGRYGGEEFGVILVGVDAEKAYYFAERLRKNISELLIEVDDHKIRFTISLGIAEISSQQECHTDWIKCADAALYASKRGGRNRTTIFVEGMES